VPPRSRAWAERPRSGTSGPCPGNAPDTTLETDPSKKSRWGPTAQEVKIVPRTAVPGLGHRAESHPPSSAGGPLSQRLDAWSGT
jgi:hypothetical protein